MKPVFPSGVSIVKVDEQQRLIPDSTNDKAFKWRVNVGRRITGVRRQRMYFDTYQEAKDFANGAVEARKKKGVEALLLNGVEMHEASRCIALLKEVDATLNQATSFYLRHHRPAHLNRTFAQVAAELLRRKRKDNRRKSTLKSYAGYFRRFSADHKNVAIARITKRSLQSWLDDLDIGPETYGNYIRNLGVVWNFAVDEGYISEAITAKIAPPASDQEPTQILTTPQAKSLLTQAQKSENVAWLPYFAISLFAGLRTNEILQLRWDQVDFEHKLITVTPSQAKTRRRRFVQMSDNLILFLKRIKTRTGPVVPFEGNAFWDGREKLREAAEMEEWPKNVLRHSFGSYYLAKHNDEGRTAAQMGNSPAVVIRNYREMVKPRDAEAYWGLKPQIQSRL